MSDDAEEKLVQEKFVTMASAYIDLANEQAKDARFDLVALSINHAAARYAVFSVSRFRADKLVPDREAIVESLVDEYRSILNRHYDEFAQMVQKA